MAGVSRLQYTTDIELIRVMCSGRVDLEFIFRAFSRGADGVFIGGCRLGECNYVTHGNFHALNLAHLAKKIMEYIGLNPDRLMISFMSSGEGNLFAEAANVFSRKVTTLGPLGSSEGLDRQELQDRLDQVRKLVPYIKIVKREALEQKLDPRECETFYTAEEIKSLFEDVVSYYIDPDKCQACMICGRKCPVQAISGGKNQVHVIDQDKCIKCGTCMAACPDRFSAVQAIKGQPAPPPPSEAQRMLAGRGEKGQATAG